MAKETILYEVEKPQERVILIAVDEDGNLKDDCLNELEELANTAGAVTVGRIVQKREKRHPGHYIGKGKAEEVKMMITALYVKEDKNGTFKTHRPLHGIHGKGYRLHTRTY